MSNASKSLKRVFLVDDEAAVRRGQQLLLEMAGFEVVGQADSAEAALDIADGIEWDLAISDLKMPGLSGLDLTRLLKRRWPDRPVLLVSTFDEDQYAEQAVERSASGYVMKSRLADALVPAVQCAMGGGIWLSDRIWDALLPSQLRTLPELSPADLDALTTLADVPMPDIHRAKRAGATMAEWQAIERRLQRACGLYSPVQLTLLAHQCLTPEAEQA